MTNTDYLQQLLTSQTLGEKSDQLKALREERAKVESILRAAFPDATITIRYGGSYIKGTMIRESYDLDIVCYFGWDETAAGDTLSEIYANVKKALEPHYLIQERTSALRLKSREPKTLGTDFHIDVVPGRFVDASQTDCFIHQNMGTKERLKTNLDVHIAHVKDSGVVDALRVLKLWRVRQGLQLKQFVFELLCIDLLKGQKKAALDSQVLHVWGALTETPEAPTVEDPANPSGNDLSSLLSDSVWLSLTAAAKATVDRVESDGWESVFGKVDPSSEAEKVARLAAVARVATPTKPWAAD